MACDETTTYLYTDGTTGTGGYDGAVPPAGLEYQETTPGGATTTTLYYGNGAVAQVTNPDGLQTTYTYDGVGRETQQTVVSDSYPNGLSTSYQYDPEGQVTTETDPPVTDQVTGAIHTAQTSTTYDLDGDVLSQTVSDTSGGDAPRTVSYSYNSNDWNPPPPTRTNRSLITPTTRTGTWRRRPIPRGTRPTTPMTRTAACCPPR